MIYLYREKIETEEDINKQKHIPSSWTGRFDQNLNDFGEKRL